MIAYIPDDLYCSLRSSRSINSTMVGNITPDGTDKAAQKRKKTVDRMGERGYKSLSFKNQPQYGFKFSNFSYSNSGDGHAMVYDPRGFVTETPLRHFEELLTSTTIKDGEILKQCVWVRDGRNNRLVTVDSEEYLNIKKTTDGIKKKYGMKDLNINDTVTLKDGTVGCYLGSFYTIEFQQTEEEATNQFSHKIVTIKTGVFRGTKKYRFIKTNRDNNVKIEAYSNLKIIDIEKPTDNGLLDDYEDYMNEQLINDKDVFHYLSWRQTSDVVGFTSKKIKTLDSTVKFKEDIDKTYFNTHRYYHGSGSSRFILDDGDYYRVRSKDYSTSALKASKVDVIFKDGIVYTEQERIENTSRYYTSSAPINQKNFTIGANKVFVLEVVWLSETLDKKFTILCG